MPRSSVDLPDPFGPTRARTRPAVTLREAPLHDAQRSVAEFDVGGAEAGTGWVRHGVKVRQALAYFATSLLA
jgi:hypothetical protein